MNKNERLELEKMISANNVEDCTYAIRDKKHSIPIRNDINKLLSLKKQYSSLEKTNPQEFDNILIRECSFVFNHYTDIFNRVKKDEIDLKILWQLIDVLKKIEDNEYDQHNGSYEVGKLLKTIYVDSALKKGEKLDLNNKSTTKSYIHKNITWNQYKHKIK